MKIFPKPLVLALGLLLAVGGVSLAHAREGDDNDLQAAYSERAHHREWLEHERSVGSREGERQARNALDRDDERIDRALRARHRDERRGDMPREHIDLQAAYSERDHHREWLEHERSVGSREGAAQARIALARDEARIRSALRERRDDDYEDRRGRRR